MKKLIFLSALLAVSAISFSQMSEKFVKAMENRIAMLDTASSTADLTDLANAFERIAEAEKNQWLHYYYAAYCNVSAGLIIASGGDMMAAKAEKTDPYADKADKQITRAEEMVKNNSELFVVKKMIATLRMLGDPMNRFMTYGPEGTAMLEEAKKLNPENPRVYLLEAQDKYFTPEQFGGSKTEAKVLLEKSLALYDSFKPENGISPNWGKNQVQAILALYK